MKSKWIIVSVLVAALLCLCAASLFAVWTGVRMAQTSGVHIRWGDNSVSATATEKKSLAVSGAAELEVNSDFGDIQVLSGDAGQVNITAEKTGWGKDDAEAQAMTQGLKISYDQTGNKISITAKQSIDVNTLSINQRNATVKFTITVPKESKVSLNSVNGDLNLAGVNGDIHLQTDYGKIDLQDAYGDIFARTSNGHISARTIGGAKAVELSSEYGDIDVTGAKGSGITISSNNGSLKLENLTTSGLLKAKSEFGEINIKGSELGQADIDTANGKVRVESTTVSAALVITSQFGDLVLEQAAAGSYDLTSTNGKIDVDGAGGSIKAVSDFGEVKVINAKDADLNLESKNGGVTFSGSLAKGPHTIKSEFGNVSLSLPEASALDVDLKTEFGKISSDFDITMSGKKLDEKHWAGKINGGGAELSIKNNNGNINLEILK